MSTTDVSPKKPSRLWRILLRIFCGLAAGFVALMAFCALCLACKARHDGKVLRDEVHTFGTGVVAYEKYLEETIEAQNKTIQRLTGESTAPATSATSSTASSASAGAPSVSNGTPVPVSN